MFVEIIHTYSGDVLIKMPYVQALINELKDEIPWQYRQWDRVEKVWRIDKYYKDEALEIIENYFPDAETIDLARAAMARRTPETPSWAKALYVQPDAPREVMEAAYRALSKKHHPDLGGSEAMMKQLNDAIEQARAGG
ncbi:DnaJ domain protein [Sporotomaculum syntrophicum]|uniref:DnaJ domain protein n=1 Tax=Sporotomaculum syntrophicum TaxID=182264 RepID=A0A9D3AYK2_9FIRM|nr:hypothetical protein [Sporotomaculum syntrophicum]KAF1084853.1 DnaJ domain protein [Sporotomaculum syntrophicum]